MFKVDGWKTQVYSGLWLLNLHVGTVYLRRGCTRVDVMSDNSKSKIHREVVLEIFEDHGGHATPQIILIDHPDDISKQHLNEVLNDLVDDGEVERVKRGLYQLTDEGSKHASDDK